MPLALKNTLASPWVAAALIGGLMLAARYAPQASFKIAPWIAGGAMLLAVVVAAVAGFLAAAPERSLPHAALVAATPAVLVAAGFGLFLTIDTRLERVAAAVATVGIAAAYVAYAKGVAESRGGFSEVDFGHVSAAVHAVAVFLIFAFGLSVTYYLNAQMWMVAVVVALILVLVSMETLRRAGLERHAAGAVLTAGMLALLGVELFIAASFLPTVYLVSAAAAAVVYSAAQHAAMDILAGRVRETAMRRQALLTLSLLILLFATAHWA